MPTDWIRIPLELDEFGGLPQQQTYECDPAIDKIVNDLWNVTARIKFKHALSKLKAKCAKRNFQVKPPDMNPELWARLVHLWTEQQANPKGRPPIFPEVYTGRRQHKRKGKDQLPVYCNDEAQEIGEKLTAEYAARQEEERFDSTIAHGELLLRATSGVKKGWLKALNIHTHPQDISVSTSRWEPFRPPIIGQSNSVIELEQTVESLEADNNSFRQSQITLMTDNKSLRQQQLTFTTQMQQLYQHLGMTPTNTSGTITLRTPRDI
ncbi:hypothetical protein SLEP1_g39499 [Rubroshorea leprosula]|uniref:Transposase n=1 Tax=Rubroshorea leprosula TaxID=152421 RepID=A0AAV5L135_9ROSI|nr:hypothetical protein SLEP1_g39499 [Rubroshorea leprosula]